jgi:hypothetical protein
MRTITVTPMEIMVVIIIALMMVLSIVTGSWGAPYLVCDPQAGVTSYRITLDPFWTVPLPAQPDGSLKADLGGVVAGNHTIAVSACWTKDVAFGEVCSATSPFTFAKPAGPSGVLNIRIVP